MEMLDLRDVERELMHRLREHTARFEQVGGHPWGDEARAEAQADLDTALWGIPPATPAAPCASWPSPPTCHAWRTGRQA
jgi:hypothetical protein